MAYNLSGILLIRRMLFYLFISCAALIWRVTIYICNSSVVYHLHSSCICVNPRSSLIHIVVASSLSFLHTLYLSLIWFTVWVFPPFKFQRLTLFHFRLFMLRNSGFILLCDLSCSVCDLYSRGAFSLSLVMSSA